MTTELPEILPAGSVLQGRVMPIPYCLVSGEAAVDCVQALHVQRPDRHAFIMGSADEALSHIVLDFGLPEPAQVQKTLTAAEAMTLNSWLDQVEAEESDFWGGDDSYELPMGRWPFFPNPQKGFSAPVDLITDQFVEQIVIGLGPAPVSRSWALFTELGYGGWNDCPDPAVHTMLQKNWADRYQTQIVSLTFDTVELSVGNPVRSRKEALELALVQYRYCSDIVEQGVGSLKALAASLMGARSWYFWWD